MARVIHSKLIYQRFESRLNPCRWCGERAEFQRERSNFNWREDVRVCCPQVEEPIYAEPVDGNLMMDAAKYYDHIFHMLLAMVDLWNDRNDAPGFIVGLA